jgi:hypothetical protein
MKEQANADAKHASGGFNNLANTISARWKKVDGTLKIELDTMAKLDRERYDLEVEKWRASMLKIAEDVEAASKAAASVAEDNVHSWRRVAHSSLSNLGLTCLLSPSRGILELKGQNPPPTWWVLDWPITKQGCLSSPQHSQGLLYNSRHRFKCKLPTSGSPQDLPLMTFKATCTYLLIPLMPVT